MVSIASTQHSVNRLNPQMRVISCIPLAKGSPTKSLNMRAKTRRNQGNQLRKVNSNKR